MTSSASGRASGSLPVERGSFIGRDADLARMVGALRATRLVTIVGPGGSGKTRLAVRTAGLAAADRTSGVWFCDLAATATEVEVATAVAATLEVGDRPGVSPLDAIAERLCNVDALLVLDNCEPVIESAAHLADAIVRACPKVTILATSREPLGVSGEVLHRLAPLPVPPAGTSPMGVARYESVQLFAQRAQAVDASFALDADSSAAVAEICRRVDGLPLAVELAAAQIAVRTPAEIVDGLADRLRLLRNGPRVGVARHRSAEASVRWSYDLLSVDEQALFGRLAVFAGAFDRHGAEVVGRGGDIPADGVGDLLARLVARSMVVAEPSPTGMRFRLLETLRAFAQQRLAESGVEDQARRNHFEHIAAQVTAGFRAARPTESGNEGLAAIDSLRDDVTFALTWALEHDADRGLRFAARLRQYWVMRGRYREGLSWADAFAQAVGTDQLADTATARCLTATFLQYLGDLRGAVEAAGEAADLARRAADPRVEARALNTLGWPQALLHADAGADTLGEAEAKAEAAGDPFIVVEAVLARAALEMIIHGPAAAAPVIERGLRAAADADHQIGLLMLDSVKGSADVLSGHPAAAKASLGAAVAGLDATGFPYWAGFARVYLGLAHQLTGHFDEADQWCRDAVVVGDRISNPMLTTYGWTQVAMSRLARGDRAGAGHAAASARAAATVGGWMGTGLDVYAAAIEARMAVDEDLERASAIIEDAHQRIEGIEFPFVHATIDLVAAVAARATGDNRVAEALGLDALGRLVESGHDAFAPEALDVLAATAADTGDAIRSARLTAAAAGQRVRMGTRPIGLGLLPESPLPPDANDPAPATSLNELLAWLRRGRTGRKRPSTGWDSLTPTERSVVELVIEGRTNAQVAARLFIARRTVTTHLSHVFDKLGVKSRTELATLAARHREL